MSNIGFYVSVIYNDDHRLVSGPYRTKERAEANVDIIRKYIVDNYDQAVWYGYGVAKVASDDLQPGCLDETLHFDGIKLF